MLLKILNTLSLLVDNPLILRTTPSPSMSRANTIWVVKNTFASVKVLSIFGRIFPLCLTTEGPMLSANDLQIPRDVITLEGKKKRWSIILNKTRSIVIFERGRQQRQGSELFSPETGDLPNWTTYHTRLFDRIILLRNQEQDSDIFLARVIFLIDFQLSFSLLVFCLCVQEDGSHTTTKSLSSSPSSSATRTWKRHAINLRKGRKLNHH